MPRHMQIKIKLQGSQLIDIDIYEVADSSLEATLKSILGTYEPRLSTRSSATVLSVPSPVDFSSSEALVPVQDPKQMTRAEWDSAMSAFATEGSTVKFTTWLDNSFDTNAFSKASSVHGIVTNFPKVSRLSYRRWVGLVETLALLEAVRPITEATVNTYYNLALRLDD